MYQNMINKIIIHHTWSPDNPSRYDWEAIRRYHLDVKEWDDIGYHYGIEKVDSVYQLFRGRPEHVVGAHCVGNNMNSLGIAVIGNFDTAEPVDEVYSMLALLCCSRMQKHPKITAIEPHNKYADKTCPGKKFNMEKLVNLVNDMRKAAN